MKTDKDNYVPTKQQEFLIDKFSQSLQICWKDDNESERLISSNFLLNLILYNDNVEMNDKKQYNLREYREDILAIGTTTYKAIETITIYKFNELNNIDNRNTLLFENSDPFHPFNFQFNKEYIMKLKYNDINNLYKRHIANNKLNKKVFEHITSHHQNLMKFESIINKDEKSINDYDEDIDNKNDDIALINYANAAKIMGDKQWVIDGNNWMKQFAIDYFMNGLAKKLFLKQYRKDIGKKFNRVLLPEEEIDIMQKLSNDNLINDNSHKDNSNGDNKRYRSCIRLYDVGSCYNPFQDCKEFSVTALDLYPVHDSSVYKCDFLELEIGSSDTSIVFKKIEDNNDNNKSKSFIESHYQLLQLPCSSSDTLCMSLVLSYLPTPIKRIEMIKKARKLLVSPGYNNCIERSGILLIIEKESITSTGKYNNKFIKLWKASIIEQGFQFLRYELLISGSRKSHAFAFKTTNIEFNDLNLIDKFPLYIKQDFDKNGNGLKEIDDMFSKIDIDSLII